ncbi:MAG: hypothetical protein ACJAT7_002004 [Psychromonas sp.]|jgi:hypothetical protein
MQNVLDWKCKTMVKEKIKKGLESLDARPY